jgi:hypothetical protein
MSLAPQLIVAISKFDGVGEKNIVAGAEVIITRRAGGAQNIYSDEAGTSLITQPAYTDANGELKFFIADGAYTYTIAGQSYSVDVNSSQTATFSTVTADKFIGDQFVGREIILEDASYGRVLVRDIADNTHYAEFKYEAPGNRATLSRTGYIHFDMSPDYVGVYDQVGAPILKGETTRTRLYRGGAEVFNVDADLLKIGFSASLDILLADVSDSAVRIRNPNGTYPLSSAGGTLSLERPDGADVLVSTSGVTNLASYSGGNLLTSTPSVTALYSPAAQPVITASSTTTTINAGNGASSISIDNAGGVSLSSTLRIPTNTKINFGTGVAGLNHTNTGTMRLYSNIINYNELATYDLSGDYQGSLISSDLLIGLANQTGLLKLYVNTAGDTVASGSMTAANFYGNGYNITQLNASEVKNGLLPSNIFPSTISAATITFAGAHIAKGGTAYNLLDVSNTATVLRNAAGQDMFFGDNNQVTIKRANNILLNASGTATQLFNYNGSIRANFDASVSQIFSPATVPFISATTTTAAITSGNGAPCLSIDSTGAGLMKFPVYTVGTVPSASANADRVIIVSNASLGRGLYTSDGTNWRSAQSGTILS